MPSLVSLSFPVEPRISFSSTASPNFSTNPLSVATAVVLRERNPHRGSRSPRRARLHACSDPTDACRHPRSARGPRIMFGRPFRATMLTATTTDTLANTKMKESRGNVNSALRSHANPQTSEQQPSEVNRACDDNDASCATEPR